MRIYSNIRQLLGELVATDRLEAGAKLDHSYEGVEVWAVQFGTCLPEVEDNPSGRRLNGLWLGVARLFAPFEGREGRTPEGRKEYTWTQESRRGLEEILDLKQRPGDIFSLDGKGQYLFGDAVEEATGEAEILDARRRPLPVGARRHLPARGDRRGLALVEPAPETGEVALGRPKALLL
jgi:hypothetical protein